MNTPTPSFSVQVDVTNPGQFFASCGLLELAHRLWPGAEGWFESEQFAVATPKKKGSLPSLLDQLLTADIQRGSVVTVIRDSVGKPAQLGKVLPIEIGDPFDLRLAWWLDEIEGCFTELKLWSGQQQSWGVFEVLWQTMGAFDLGNHDLFDLFDHHAALKSRIGLDPRSAWDGLDAGFSPNKLQIPVSTYVAVEVLGAIGLCACRPRLTNDRFTYTTWRWPLAAPVARAVSAGAIAMSGAVSYEFALRDRGQFQAFSYATPTTNNL